MAAVRRLYLRAGGGSLRDLGRLWYKQAPDAVDYAKFYSRSHDAVIRVYDEAGNVIETHEHAGEFKEW
jgi:hypothetical protein